MYTRLLPSSLLLPSLSLPSLLTFPWCPLYTQGGPGKGMYTRLYQNILNRYPSVEAATVFNAFYNGTGEKPLEAFHDLPFPYTSPFSP